MCELCEAGRIAKAVCEVESASSDAHGGGGSKTMFFRGSEKEILLRGAILAGDARECDGNGATSEDFSGVALLEVFVDDGEHARVDGHVGEVA